MIDEPLQEQASLYVLGMLEREDKLAFEAELARNSELRAMTRDLEKAAVLFVHAAEPVKPPDGLKTKIMAAVQEEKMDTIPQPPASASGRSGSWIPWAIAACVAIGCALFLMMDRSRMQSEQDRLAKKVDELTTKDNIAQYKVAVLATQLEAFKNGAVSVIWDAEKQQGVLDLSKMPQPEQEKDYQLWVIDSSLPAPVSAGVIKVDQNGASKMNFKPQQPVKGEKFAISIENKGGAASPTADQIILISN